MPEKYWFTLRGRQRDLDFGFAENVFSGKGFGSIYGYFAISMGIGSALGSWLGGFLHDLTGSYLISFSISAVLLALSDLSIWLASLKWVSSYDERLWARRSEIEDR